LFWGLIGWRRHERPYPQMLCCVVHATILGLLGLGLGDLQRRQWCSLRGYSTSPPYIVLNVNSKGIKLLASPKCSIGHKNALSQLLCVSSRELRSQLKFRLINTMLLDPVVHLLMQLCDYKLMSISIFCWKCAGHATAQASA
jgi:hypothetical protein